jgi:hypothetical protein
MEEFLMVMIIIM